MTLADTCIRWIRAFRDGIAYDDNCRPGGFDAFKVKFQNEEMAKKKFICGPLVWSRATGCIRIYEKFFNEAIFAPVVAMDAFSFGKPREAAHIVRGANGLAMCSTRASNSLMWRQCLSTMTVYASVFSGAGEEVEPEQVLQDHPGLAELNSRMEAEQVAAEVWERMVADGIMTQ